MEMSREIKCNVGTENFKLAQARMAKYTQIKDTGQLWLNLAKGLASDTVCLACRALLIFFWYPTDITLLERAGPLARARSYQRARTLPANCIQAIQRDLPDHCVSRTR